METKKIDDHFIGKNVIIRTHNAGSWFGLIKMKVGCEVILEDARQTTA